MGFEDELTRVIMLLDNWFSNWQKVNAIVKTKEYTLAELQQLALIYDATIVPNQTKYNFVINNKVVFTGSIAQNIIFLFDNFII